jgi:hypothetical protein
MTRFIYRHTQGDNVKRIVPVSVQSQIDARQNKHAGRKGI